MKRRLLLFVLLGILSCQKDTLFPDASAIDQEPTHPSNDRMTYVVAFNPRYTTVQGLRAQSPGDRESRLKALAVQTIDRLQFTQDIPIGHVFSNVFEGVTLELTAREADMLRRAPEIAQVENDFTYHLAQLTPPQLIQADSTQLLPWGIQKIHGALDGKGHTAWIMDTGIDLDHPDLNVDQERSRNFVPWQYYEFDADDLNGHGTHVAGVIAAKDNNIGTVGVAAGATVVSVKVLSRNGVSLLSTLLKGLDYIQANAKPGDVVNLSLSGRPSALLDMAVEKVAAAGVSVVLAAGNFGRDIQNFSPARVDAPNVYTISAIDDKENFASFSNFGHGIDFAEPGVNIPSTYRDGTYALLSGTSMAAPHVTGLLLLKNNIHLTTMGYAIKDPDGEADPILGKE